MFLSYLVLKKHFLILEIQNYRNKSYKNNKTKAKNKSKKVTQTKNN